MNILPLKKSSSSFNTLFIWFSACFDIFKNTNMAKSTTAELNGEIVKLREELGTQISKEEVDLEFTISFGLLSLHTFISKMRVNKAKANLVLQGRFARWNTGVLAIKIGNEGMTFLKQDGLQALPLKR